LSRFYQRQNPNSQSSLFHHGLIRVLFNAHLLNRGDSWQIFLVRNGFVSFPSEHVPGLPLCVYEHVVLSISSHSLQSFRVEIQVSKDPVLPLDTPVEFRLIVEVTSKKREFIPRKSLEEILSHLKDKMSVTPDPV
jgi:hypothetical protein